MKKILLLAVISFGIVSVKAQKLDAAKVPEIVKQSFEKKYPGIIAKWEKEDNNYEAGFKQNGNEMSAVIEPNGTIAEIETDIKITALPATVLNYVKEHYAGKSIQEAAKNIKADGTITYEAGMADSDLIFDSNGKFIKEVKEGKEEKD